MLHAVIEGAPWLAYRDALKAIHNAAKRGAILLDYAPQVEKLAAKEAYYLGSKTFVQELASEVADFPASFSCVDDLAAHFLKLYRLRFRHWYRRIQRFRPVPVDPLPWK